MPLVPPPDWVSEIAAVFFDYTKTLTCPGQEPCPYVCLPVDPLAADTVRTLWGRGYRLGVASNTLPQRPRNQALEDAGIARLLHAVLQSHELGVHKPQAEFWDAVVEAAGVGPSKILLVDDRLEYVRAATTFGLRAAHVVQPGGCAVERQLPATAVQIGHVSDLTGMLPAVSPSTSTRAVGES